MLMEMVFVMTMAVMIAMASTMLVVFGNGPGPIYDCGCADIAPGECDCAGSLPDDQGNCQTFMSDTDNDGFYDTLLNPCLDQSNVPYYGEAYSTVAIGDQCWFQQNLNTVRLSQW